MDCPLPNKLQLKDVLAQCGYLWTPCDAMLVLAS